MKQANEEQIRTLKIAFKLKHKNTIIKMINKHSYPEVSIRRWILSTLKWCDVELLKSFLLIKDFDINFSEGKFFTCAVMTHNFEVVNYLVSNDLCDTSGDDFKAFIYSINYKLTTIAPLFLNYKTNRDFLSSKKVLHKTLPLNEIKSFIRELREYSIIQNKLINF